MSDYGLGRRYAPDQRDSSFPMLARLDLAAPLPRYKYWSAPFVLDQLDTPQCVGYAWSAWLHASPTRTKIGPHASLIYSEAQKVDEWPGEGYAGTSVRAGAKVMQAQGRIAEYVWASDVETIKRWVLTRGGIVVGTDWYASMFKTNAWDYLVVNPSSGLVGGHAWFILGYSAARESFRALNSWGRSWGDQGRFWLRATDLATLLESQGEACAAIEKTPHGLLD